MSTREITTALCNFMKEVPALSTMTTAKIPTKNGKGFEFEFAEGANDYGSVVVSILDEGTLKVYFKSDIVELSLIHISEPTRPERSADALLGI